MSEIGKALRYERKKRKLTQKQAADLIGISRSYFSDLEAGRYYPSGKVLLKLNSEFNIFYLLSNDGKTRQK